jgi:predicted amidohydrolase
MTDSSLAVVQFAPVADTGANIRSIAALAATAVERGATLVVLPEYSSYFSPTMGQDWADAAEPLDGRFATAIGELAVSLSIHIVAGMVERREDGARFSNTVIAFDPTGTLVATYRKLHLYDAFGQKESDWVVAGNIEEPQLFPWNGFTVGLQTCYDIRFPEVTRRIVDAGADVVLVPAEWVRGPLKEHHWRTLLTARALENTIYIAAADHAPPIGAGNSMVVDPMGVELVTIGETSGVAVAWLAPDRISEVRAVNPSLAARRFAVIPR